jgi:hypothetical protein
MPSKLQILSWKKSTDDIIYVNESFLAKVKSEAQKLHKQRKRSGHTSSLSEARDICAKSYGFESWIALCKIHNHERSYGLISGTIVGKDEDHCLENALTARQEYGALCRHAGIDPLQKRYEIHITIGEDRAIEYLSNDQLKSLGLLYDYEFERGLKACPFFSDGCEMVYRLLSIDSQSYKEVDRHLLEIGQSNDDCSGFWPLTFGHCWINGVLDPGTMETWKIDQLEYPDIPKPLETLPEEVWRSPYK